MTVKTIFFDAAGTLIKTMRPVGESYAAVARKYGVEVRPAELSDRFRSCFAASPPLAFPGSPVEKIPELERRWWRDLVRHIFEPYGSFPRFEVFFSELFDYFSRAEAWALYPETEETLSKLSERGLRLAIISNFDSRLLGILDGLALSRWLDSVTLSSRAGHAKPAAEIFRRALALHGARPEEAMHIGDSPDKDAAGARAAELTGILIDRSGKAAADGLPRIQNLKEIFSLIDAR